MCLRGVKTKKNKNLCSSSALLDVVSDVILKNNKEEKSVPTALKLDVQMECSRLWPEPGVTGLRYWTFEKATLCGYGGASDAQSMQSQCTVEIHGGGGGGGARCCPPFACLFVQKHPSYPPAANKTLANRFIGERANGGTPHRINARKKTKYDGRGQAPPPHVQPPL